METNIEQVFQEYLDLLQAEDYDYKYNKLKYAYPDTGPFRKEFYKVHLDFMDSQHMEAALFGGNGSGKTFCGGTLAALHLTGLYPNDYKGRRFTRGIKAWCVGVTFLQVKEVMQEILLGPINDIGSGMIPKELIVKVTAKHAMPNSIESFEVRHISGEISKCTFMACQQERPAFQGPNIDYIWMDEEPKDFGIYAECLARLRNPYKPGLIRLTFTPLSGLSEVCKSFLNEGHFSDNGTHPINPEKYAARISLRDVPHVTKQFIENVKRSYPRNQMKARIDGFPVLGSGAIYPYEEDQITCAPFEIPKWWPRAYGFDVGTYTAAVWIALNPDENIYYLYSEYYVEDVLPVIHASAIKARGDWIIGAIDPASRMTSANDRKKIHETYLEEGLHLELADNAVEAGILKQDQLFAAGRLKIFSSCRKTISQTLSYHRDEEGRIAGKANHCPDATRYCLSTWDNIWQALPDEDENLDKYYDRHHFDGDLVTGY